MNGLLQSLFHSGEFRLGEFTWDAVAVGFAHPNRRSWLARHIVYSIDTEKEAMFFGRETLFFPRAS
jgi:hypothetical protein